MKRTIKVAAIFSDRYLDFSGNKKQIGGVETYISNLANLCLKLNIEPIVFQYSDKYFEQLIDNIIVIGLPVLRKRERARRFDAFRHASKKFDIETDIVIFAKDGCAVPYKSNRCVSIQHGISWDLPNNIISPKKIWQYRWANGLFRLRLHRHAIRLYERCPNHVFVDYNFVNWFRTFRPFGMSENDWIIPNFTDIPDAVAITSANEKRKAADVKVLFARRFCDYRGTRIMADAAKSLLHKYPHVSFTFAGEGPDESWLNEQFASEPRVRITKYSHEQSLEVHLQHHIAVVPSIGSEGTSLSVAEAMACGCAVVATAVGGITNMIIDGFNGKLTTPVATKLERSIEELILDKAQRDRITCEAYDTANYAFSRQKWEAAWSNVIHILGR